MVRQGDIHSFHQFLGQLTAGSPPMRSPRIFGLCGAGLSASSGLPTFRGSTGALWENYDPMTLATPDAFARDPVTSWRFYAYRRSLALQAAPNAGHYALAALAHRCPGFLCVTQNVDGHPPGQLRRLHGSLFDIRCVDEACGYKDRDNWQDPLCEALRVVPGQGAPVIPETNGETGDRGDPARGTDIAVNDLPHCPSCRGRGKSSLLRPGVVWFGEMLDTAMVRDIDTWIESDTIDFMLVIGTSMQIASAVGYVHDMRAAGVPVVTINLDAETLGSLAGMEPGDFAFGGDAAQLLPVLLAPLIGEVGGGDGSGSLAMGRPWYDGEDSS